MCIDSEPIRERIYIYSINNRSFLAFKVGEIGKYFQLFCLLFLIPSFSRYLKYIVTQKHDFFNSNWIEYKVQYGWIRNVVLKTTFNHFLVNFIYSKLAISYPISLSFFLPFFSNDTLSLFFFIASQKGRLNILAISHHRLSSSSFVFVVSSSNE